MGFSFQNLTRWLLIGGVPLAVAFPALAQQAGRRPGQAIIFSSADGDDVSSNVPSLTAKPPGMLDFANAVQSPAANSGAAAQDETLPAPPPAISPVQAQQMRRQNDERKNWALLTPEEILGVSAQEKKPGVQDRDADGQPKNETVVAQFYERQEQLRAHTNDDNYSTPDAAARWDVGGNQELQMNPNIWVPAGNKQGNLASSEHFLNVTPDNWPGSAQAPPNGWLKPFSPPAPAPAPTPEQQAAMEQFQQLLQPHSLPGRTAKAPAPGGSLFSSLSTLPNSGPGQPGIIPIGGTYAPLTSGIGLPVGVAPLPGLLGQNNTTAPAFVPGWKPQPPPWMSSAPQLGVIPQRKF